MRELVVSKAPLPRVAATVKEQVEAAGGVASVHTHTSTEFDHLRARDDAWSRSGYIGTYQPLGQDRVRIRIRLWASWPRRLFLFFAYLGLIEAVVFFGASFAGASPPPNVWILTAILTFAGLAISLLTYASSWATSHDIEEDLARAIGSELQADEQVPGDVYTVGTWQEHRQEVIEAALAEAKAEEPPQAAATSASGGGLVTQLKQRVGLGKEDEEDADRAPSPPPEDEAAQEETDEPDEQTAREDEDDEPEEKRSFKDRIPFLGKKDAEPSEEDDAGAETEDQDDEPEEKRAFKDRIPFLGGKGDDEDAEPDEPDQDEAEATETDR